jgi:hypothetical protein
MNVTNNALKIMLHRIEIELTVIELFAYTCYFANPELSGAQAVLGPLGGNAQVYALSRADYRRCLQAIRRVEALRGGISARL